MKIVVLNKQILDPRGITVRRDRERIFVNVEEYIISSGDKVALEAALRLGGEGDEIVALSLGEPRAEDALREALALGADAAILLTDPLFKEADWAAVARTLAVAIGKLGGAGLVLCGRESGDTGAGQVAGRLAELLGAAQVTDAYDLALVNGAVQATRRWSEGYARVEAPLPAVISLAPDAYIPRYAHGARIMNAYREWTVTTWNADDLGLDRAALRPLTVFRGEAFPPPLEVGEVLRGDPASVALGLVSILKLQKLV